MRPSQLEPFGSEPSDTHNSRRQVWSQEHLNMQTRSHQSTRRSRFDDSWIDLASQPSSSSLASQTNQEEIITTGLQIRRQGPRRSRQLRLSNTPPSQQQPQPRSTSVAGSSQDEYEESESESDRLMSSSNEDVSNNSNIDEEETDAHTALGIPIIERNVFTPQPNAFSHPPQSRSVPASDPQPLNSYFPPEPLPVSSHRIPSNRVPTIQRPAVQRATTSVTPDHDAALRASLTTLLSCANAVRKDREPVPVIQVSSQPTTLRLVPESQLNTRKSPSSSPKLVPKRRSRESSKERHSKKLRAATKTTTTPTEEVMLSPTMMTWFISAGVVLVFSAISFSAGYAWGKEVGRVEGQMGLDGVSCGREAMRGSRTGLSKLRLSSVRA